MNQSFRVTKDLLVPCKASELKPGFIFYIVRDDGTFDKCEVDLKCYPTPGMKEKFRAKLREWSKTGKMFRRRDKAFHDFRDML